MDNPGLIKSPKLYFYDTGLLCWLLGIREAGQLAAHPLRGAIFETLVVSELVKTRFNQGERAGLHFWRDSNGNEVDVIAEAGPRLLPIEIKSGQTLNRDFFTGLERWQALAGDLAVSPSLVYGATAAADQAVARPLQPVHKGIAVYGWNEVQRILCA